MKKSFFVITAVLAFGLVGCQQKPNSNAMNVSTAVAPEAPSVEEPMDQMEIIEDPTVGNSIVFLENGKLSLYDIASHETRPYFAESGNIVNFVCSDDGKLYFDVEENGRLLLKSLDLKVTPEPTNLVDWGVVLGEQDEFSTMSPYGPMYLNRDHTQIGLETDVYYFAGGFFSNLAVYDIASGTLQTYKRYRMGSDYPEDLPDNSGFDIDYGGGLGDIDNSQFVDEEGLLYYFGHPVGNGEYACMNDKIDYETIFSFDISGFEFTAEPVSIDPTGQRVLLFYNAYLGDGIVGVYSVSTLDGKEQFVMSGTGEESHPQWLPDGSLVYIGYDGESTLCLMDTDGTTHTIGNASVFSVIP